MHRTRFQKRKKDRQKTKMDFLFFLFSSLEVSMLDRSKPAQRSLARLTATSANIEAKLFINCKFCMILLALIPVMNYYS